MSLTPLSNRNSLPSSIVENTESSTVSSSSITPVALSTIESTQTSPSVPRTLKSDQIATPPFVPFIFVGLAEWMDPSVRKLLDILQTPHSPVNESKLANLINKNPWLISKPVVNNDETLTALII